MIGCEVHYKQSFADRVRKNIRPAIPTRLRRLIKDNKIFSEIIIADRETDSILIKDKGLRSHVKKIRSALKAYDPVVKYLTALDHDEISDIIGVCEDIGGNRSRLNLKGDVEGKIDYVISFLFKKFRIVLERACIANKLFEMSGFCFENYDAGNSHRLIKLNSDGRSKYCVIGSDETVEYWVDDINLVNQMHLLEHSVKANPKLNKSLDLCTKGHAKPFRLLFKKPFEIDYSIAPLPSLYRDIFEMYDIGLNEKELLIKSLKNSQLGILFNYLPMAGSSEQKLCTNVSVMHEVSALEPIKNNLPELYSLINRMASVSEAGKYYLLDSIKAYRNE